MNKKGKTETLTTLVGIGVLVMVVYFVGPSFGLNIFGKADTPGTSVDVKVSNTVPTATDTTLELSAYDKYAPSTASGGKHRLFLDGYDNGNVSDKGTTTISPTDPITVYYEYQSANGNNDYYVKKLTVPPWTPGIPMVTASNGKTYNRDTGSLKLSEQVYKYGNVTFTFYNDDNTASTAQAMDSNSEYTVGFKLKAPNDAAFGNPDIGCNNVMCITYNSTAFTKFDVEEMSNANTPNIHVNLALTNENRSVECWSFPPMVNSESKDYTLIVTTGSGAVGADNLASVWGYDCDFDFDQDDGTEIIGVEDEDNQNLGLTSTTTTAMIGTILVS